MNILKRIYLFLPVMSMTEGIGKILAGGDSQYHPLKEDAGRAPAAYTQMEDPYVMIVNTFLFTE